MLAVIAWAICNQKFLAHIGMKILMFTAKEVVILGKVENFCGIINCGGNIV